MYECRLKVIVLLQVSSHYFEPTFIIFFWIEEYCQTSPNKNQSPNLWHVTSILVCCIFDEGDAYISYILDVLFSFFQQVLAYFISGTFHNSWSAVERKFFSYSSLSIYFTKFNFIFHFTLKKMENWNSWQKLYFWCKTMIFCYQNCSDLLGKKIVLVIKKNFWYSRLKAETLQKFWDH